MIEDISSIPVHWKPYDRSKIRLYKLARHFNVCCGESGHLLFPADRLTAGKFASYDFYIRLNPNKIWKPIWTKDGVRTNSMRLPGRYGI
jgi:hypothetical protein